MSEFQRLFQNLFPDARIASMILGKTVESVSLVKEHSLTDNEAIVFRFSDGSEFMISHYQEVWEDFSFVDDGGTADSLADLVGEKVLSFEIARNDEEECGIDFAMQWTYVHIRSMSTSVCIRCLGKSNGYYSMEPDFYVRGGAE